MDLFLSGQCSQLPLCGYAYLPDRLNALDGGGRRLALAGFALQQGEQLQVLVSCHWLPGLVSHTPMGWELQTPDQVQIRLHSGLLACRPLLAPPGMHQQGGSQAKR